MGAMCEALWKLPDAPVLLGGWTRLAAVLGIRHRYTDGLKLGDCATSADGACEGWAFCSFGSDLGKLQEARAFVKRRQGTCAARILGLVHVPLEKRKAVKKLCGRILIKFPARRCSFVQGKEILQGVSSRTKGPSDGEAWVVVWDTGLARAKVPLTREAYQALAICCAEEVEEGPRGIRTKFENEWKPLTLFLPQAIAAVDNPLTFTDPKVGDLVWRGAMPASIRDALKRRGLRGKDLGRVEATAGRALLDALVGVWHAYAAALGEWKSVNGFPERKSEARVKARERRKRRRHLATVAALRIVCQGRTCVARRLKGYKGENKVVDRRRNRCRKCSAKKIALSTLSAGSEIMDLVRLLPSGLRHPKFKTHFKRVAGSRPRAVGSVAWKLYQDLHGGSKPVRDVAPRPPRASFFVRSVVSTRSESGLALEELVKAFRGCKVCRSCGMQGFGVDDNCLACSMGALSPVPLVRGGRGWCADWRKVGVLSAKSLLKAAAAGGAALCGGCQVPRPKGLLTACTLCGSSSSPRLALGRRRWMNRLSDAVHRCNHCGSKRKGRGSCVLLHCEGMVGTSQTGSRPLVTAQVRELPASPSAPKARRGGRARPARTMTIAEVKAALPEGDSDAYVDSSAAESPTSEFSDDLSSSDLSDQLCSEIIVEARTTASNTSNGSRSRFSDSTSTLRRDTGVVVATHSTCLDAAAEPSVENKCGEVGAGSLGDDVGIG